jgi:hypothetical protein
MTTMPILLTKLKSFHAIQSKNYLSVVISKQLKPKIMQNRVHGNRLPQFAACGVCIVGVEAESLGCALSQARWPEWQDEAGFQCVVRGRQQDVLALPVENCMKHHPRG